MSEQTHRLVRGMAAVHADAAVFGYTAYSQDEEPVPEGIEIREDFHSRIVQSQEPCLCTKEDFIIFAEFSEVTGPIPLLTIPPKLESYEDIDINTLIMKIMSVDYQANPSGQFAFSQDVQVLQGDVLPGRHAYVHYCTLHDMRARGFVRPLCLAYVSADPIKLHDCFGQLRQQFLEATRVLKFDNRQCFSDEISRLLAGLKEVQTRYFAWKKREEEGESLSVDEHQLLARTQLDQLAHQHTELRHMLLAAEPLQEAAVEAAAEARGWQRILPTSAAPEARLYLSRLSGPAHVQPQFLSPELGMGGAREPLRPVPALAPWGLPALLWRLLRLRRAVASCRLRTTLCLFPQPPLPGAQEGSDALADPELLQLLLAAARPFDWPGPPAEPPDSLEYIEASLVASGNEASSSYHSAPESLSEMVPLSPPPHPARPPRPAGSSDGGGEDGCSASLDSFLDTGSDADSWDDPAENEDEIGAGAGPPERLLPWLSCAWGDGSPPGPEVAGRRLLRFFQRYPCAAQHALFSLLTGRTVVLAAAEALRSRVRVALAALSPLVPATLTRPLRMLWWHRGILVAAHVSVHQLIGLCVPERLSVHDMISPRDKNRVTILDMATGQLWGPAYSGQLLAALGPRCTALPSDHTLLLLLRAAADGLRERLFLLRAAIASGEPGVDPAAAAGRLGLAGCDSDILRHLLGLGLGPGPRD